MYQSCLTEFIGCLGSALQASSRLITNAKVTVLISVSNTFPTLLLPLLSDYFWLVTFSSWISVIWKGADHSSSSEI